MLLFWAIYIKNNVSFLVFFQKPINEEEKKNIRIFRKFQMRKYVDVYKEEH